MTTRIGTVNLRFKTGAYLTRLEAAPTKKGLSQKKGIWFPVGAASSRETADTGKVELLK